MLRRLRTRASLLVTAATLLVAGCEGRKSGSELTVISGPTMGTRFNVKIARLPPGQSREHVEAAIREQVDRVTALMSTYDPESELSRFNRARSGEWFPLTEDTAAVIKAARRIHEITQGAFDPTVGPAVDRWGFGPSETRGSIPSDAEVEALKGVVGFSKLRLKDGGVAIQKTVDGLRVDLSAIAKGYAVDLVAALLEARGVESYLVEIGGEVRCRGEKAEGQPWSVAVEAPTPGARSVHAGTVLKLENGALAASGDYRNFFEVDGKRYSHAIDPRTCRPVTHQLTSVCVLADTCTKADALATGLMVLGPEDGYRLAEKLRLAAYFIVVEANGLKNLATPVMEQILRESGT